MKTNTCTIEIIWFNEDMYRFSITYRKQHVVTDLVETLDIHKYSQDKAKALGFTHWKSFNGCIGKRKLK